MDRDNMPAVRSAKQIERRLEDPRPEDAVDPRTCGRCGMPGPMHASSAECISALRDALAEAMGGEIRARR